MEFNHVKLGILALQGDVEEHAKICESLGVSSIRVREEKDLEGLTHLIIPGGESTVITKLLKVFNLFDALKKRIEEGSLFVFGTCAGAIVLSKKVQSTTEIQTLEVLDVEIERNAYGAQVFSFEDTVNSKKLGDFEGVFIRAPKFKDIFGDASKLVSYKGEVVAVEQGNVIAATFHPELLDKSPLHEYFLSKK